MVNVCYDAKIANFTHFLPLIKGHIVANFLKLRFFKALLATIAP